MRILWISHLIPYPAKGGVLQRAYNLVKEISKQHEVDLLAFNQKKLLSSFYSSEELGKKDAYNHLAELCGYVEFFDIPSENTKFGKYFLALKSLFTSDPYTINWLKSVLFASNLKSLLARVDYDLVHFDTISLVPYLQFVGDIPAVLDHHNIESHMLLRRANNELNYFKRWYFKQEGERLEGIERNLCPDFQLNITCSEFDKSRLLRISKDCRVEEVPNGVDVDYFKPAENIDNNPRLIFAGTLSWYPNKEAVTFIANELWPILKNEIPNIIFDIVGANPPEVIKNLGKRDKNFKVHGFVDDVRPYLDAASVFVCPIRDGGGTKLKILDAFAMNKAVVAHSIACEGISVTEGVNVLFAESANQYIMHIKQLLKDTVYRKSIGENARTLVEQKYTYSAIGKKLSSLYEDCIKP